MLRSNFFFFFFLLNEHVRWWVECVVIFTSSCQEIVTSVAEHRPTCWLWPQPGMIDGCYSLSSVCSHLTVTNKMLTLMDSLQMKQVQIVNWYFLHWHWKTDKDTKQHVTLHRHCAVSDPVQIIAPARLLPLPGPSANDVWDQKRGMHATGGHYCSLPCKWGPQY